MKAYRHVYENQIFPSDINPQGGIISKSYTESNTKWSELHIPLVFQYTISKRFFVSLGLELTTFFADKSSRIIHYGNGTTYQLGNQSGMTMNYAPTFSIGYLVPLTDNSSLSIEPLVKVYLKEYIIPLSGLYTYGLKVTYTKAKKK